MSNQHAAGKRKHATLMISQKFEIILRLDRSKSCRVITTMYNVGMSTINDTKKQQAHL
jgi:transposase